MSLMSSLYTGVSGLNSNQRGLTVSAHNLANVETNGYVRQQLETTDFMYQTAGYKHISKMRVGYGTDVSTVKQVRDVFLDRTYREEIGREHFYKSQYEASLEVEDIFGETEGVAFQTYLHDFWISMQELCKEPDSIVTRSELIQTAASFIERAEKIYSQIKEYQESLNTEIQTYVDRINKITEEISEINKKVQLIEAGGYENANDLRDRRNELIDELSNIVNVSYKEDATGVVTVYAEGYTIVTNDLRFEMGTKLVSEDSTLITPYWPCYDGVDVFDFTKLPSSKCDTDIGALKGLLLARGEFVGRYTDKPIEPTKEEFTVNGVFNQGDYNEAMEKYNDELEVYANKVEGSVLTSIQVQFDNLVHGIVTMINDTLCPNKEVKLADGSVIKILDEENAPVGMDENSTVGEALFNRKSTERYTKQTIQLADGTSMQAYVYNDEDPTDNYTLFTIGEIEVNRKILANPSILPLSENGGTGDFAIKVSEALLEKWQAAWDTVSPFDLSDQNFQSYYTDMMGLLGTNGEKFKNLYESQEELTQSVEGQRQAVHGVASDEELTNIIKFQQGYNANSRFITTVAQMLEHLINTLGNG